MLEPADLTALWITIKLAVISTLILLVLGTPLAFWLSRTRTRAKPVIEAVVALPLVLPPTVLGFYLLIAFGPEGVIGRLSQALGGGPLAFTFTGLVIGSIFYSLPFVVQPLQDAFAAVGRRPDGGCRHIASVPGRPFCHGRRATGPPRLSYGGGPRFRAHRRRVWRCADDRRQHSGKYAGHVDCHLRTGAACSHPW